VPGEAVRTFRETLRRSGLSTATDDIEVEHEAVSHGTLMEREATHRVKITEVDIQHPGLADGRHWLLPDDPMTVTVRFHADEPTDDVLFGIAIHDEEGNNIYGTNTHVAGITVPKLDGDGEMTFAFDRIPLLDGTYLITLAILTSDEGTVYDWRDQQFQFSVMNPTREVGIVALPVAIRFGEQPAVAGQGSAA
jgi:hypothetical protein